MSFLSNLFQQHVKLVPVETFTQAQLEALVDALVFAMMADGDTDEEEWDALRASFDPAQWLGEEGLESFIAHSCERVEQVTHSQEEARVYCRNIGQRLGDRERREAAYALAARVVCSDHEIARSEQGLMTIMIQEFPIDPEHALDISAQVHEEYDLL